MLQWCENIGVIATPQKYCLVLNCLQKFSGTLTLINKSLQESCSVPVFPQTSFMKHSTKQLCLKECNLILF